LVEQVCAKFAHTADDGKIYDTKFYSLDAIIAVDFMANSIRAIQSRFFLKSVVFYPDFSLKSVDL